MGIQGFFGDECGFFLVLFLFSFVLQHGCGTVYTPPPPGYVKKNWFWLHVSSQVWVSFTQHNSYLEIQ